MTCTRFLLRSHVWMVSFLKFAYTSRTWRIWKRPTQDASRDPRTGSTWDRKIAIHEIFCVYWLIYRRRYNCVQLLPFDIEALDFQSYHAKRYNLQSWLCPIYSTVCITVRLHACLPTETNLSEILPPQAACLETVDEYSTAQLEVGYRPVTELLFVEAGQWQKAKF